MVGEDFRESVTIRGAISPEAIGFALDRKGLPAAASADWRQRDALPPSSRDTGNRISLDGLRGFAETRASEFFILRAESRVQSVSLDAVSANAGPCPSSRPRPAIPRDALRAGIAGAQAGRRLIRRERVPPGAGIAEFCLNGASSESQRTGYLQATSTLAPEPPVAERDLPRRNERPEEQMAFGDHARRRAFTR